MLEQTPIAKTPDQRGGYGQLTAQIRELGLLRSRPWSYAGHFALVFAALAAIVAAMVIWQDSWWLLLLAPAFGIVATQMGFLGHDVGHLQVTRNATRMRLLGLVDGNLMGGMSFGWWVAKHNAHHAHPNDLEGDPDVRAGVLIFDAGPGGRPARPRRLDHPPPGLPLLPVPARRGREPPRRERP